MSVSETFKTWTAMETILFRGRAWPSSWLLSLVL
ncbi:hypothetical protein ACME88_02160 [Pseudomonas aeruginosa]